MDPEIEAAAPPAPLPRSPSRAWVAWHSGLRVGGEALDHMMMMTNADLARWAKTAGIVAEREGRRTVTLVDAERARRSPTPSAWESYTDWVERALTMSLQGSSWEEIERVIGKKPMRPVLKED